MGDTSARFFVRNQSQGPVFKVHCIWTSVDHNIILKFPKYFLSSSYNCTCIAPKPAQKQEIKFGYEFKKTGTEKRRSISVKAQQCQPRIVPAPFLSDKFSIIYSNKNRNFVLAG